jgi:hypothetical protein
MKKLKRLVTFWRLALLLVLAGGCKKMDKVQLPQNEAAIEQRFFEQSADASAGVQRVAATFRSRNATTALVVPFFTKYGQPLWDKGFVVAQASRPSARNTTTGTDTVVIIPVVQPGIAEVQTYIAAHLTDTVQLAIHTGSEYRSLRFSNADTLINKAEQLAIRFMLLNKAVFNYEAFRIWDKRLFHHSAIYTDTAGLQRKVVLRSAPDNARMVTVCVDIITTPAGTRNGAAGTGECTNCLYAPPTPVTICQSWWENDDEGDVIAPGDTGSGGGGGGVSDGGDPCTGSGTLGRILPCGDPGNDGWEPLPLEDPIITNPCFMARILAHQMDSIFIKSKADSVLATLPSLATLNIEMGFPIIKTIRINPLNVRDTLVKGYHCGTVHSGTDSSVNYTYSLGRLERSVAALHTHPDSGYAAQSAKDVYLLIEERLREGSDFIGTFVAAANGSQYAITITNPYQATAFLATQSQYLLGTKWNKTSAIGIAFDLAYDYYADKVYQGHPNQTNLAYEMAMAAVLTQFNTGVTLNKRDAAGNFKPIVVTTSTDPNNPKKTIYTQICL